MSESSTKTRPADERRARGERGTRVSRLSGFSHVGPGYHDVPTSRRAVEKGKQAIRARKRKIQRKEER